MIPAAPLIALLLSLNTCAREPHDAARGARVTTLAESIAEVSDSVDDEAGLVAIAVNESGLCANVHSGARKGGPGEGLWQIEPGSNRTGPFSGLDREATTHAASEALWLWRHTRGCRGLAARFGAYAGLGCRSWPGARARVGLYGFVTMRLNAIRNRDPAPGRRASVLVLRTESTAPCRTGFALAPPPAAAEYSPDKDTRSAKPPRA